MKMDVAGCSNNGDSTTDDEKEVSCPICEKVVSAKEIVDHVDRCIFLRQEEEVANKGNDSPREAKRSFPLFERAFPAPKKMKLSPGRVGSGSKRVKTIDLTASESDAAPERREKIEDETYKENGNVPLAEKVRPKTIEEFMG